MLHVVGDDLLDVVDGDGKADALNGGGGSVAVVGILGGHDARHPAVAVKEGAAGVAGVDAAIGLDHVGDHRAVGHTDGTVGGGHGTGGLGEGEGAQGVADGAHRFAHHQVVRVAQHHGLEAGDALHLDDGHVVELLAAHQDGVVALAVVEGHLNGVGPVHHVVVGDDVAVLADDKAGTGAAGLVLVVPLLHRHLHRDAHAGVGVRGVNFRQAHGLQPVRLLHLNGHRVHGVFIDDSLPLLGLGTHGAVQGRAAQTGGTADDGTAQHQRHRPQTFSALFPLFGLRRGHGRHRLRRLAAAVMIGGIVIVPSGGAVGVVGIVRIHKVTPLVY